MKTLWMAIPVALLAPWLQAWAEPPKVDLSYMFPPLREQVGGSCHVFAAVGLVEAACYRATGKVLDLSEEYQMYRHLRETLPFPYDDATHLHSADLTTGDGGASRNTIRRIIDEQNVAIAKNAEEEEKLLYFARKLFRQEAAPYVWGTYHRFIGRGFLLGVAASPIVAAYRQKWLLRKERSACSWRLHRMAIFSRDTLYSAAGLGGVGLAGGWMAVEVLDNAVAKKPRTEGWLDGFFAEVDRQAAKTFGPGSVSAEKGYVHADKNPDLEACFEKGLVLNKGYFTPQNAVNYLDRGIPFICEGVYDSEKVRQPTYRDVDNGHVAITVGYRYRGKKKKLEFLIRDSGGTGLRWWDIKECFPMYLVTLRGEAIE